VGLLSRRVLESVLHENAAHVSREMSLKHIEQINRGNEESFAAEYEVVVINGLTKLGSVTYERDLGGPRPDIHFTSRGSGPSFVADITTVSDVDAHRQNPANDWWERFVALLKRHGLSPGGFSYKIGGSFSGPAGDRSVKLALPAREDLPRLVKGLRAFVRRVAETPSLPAATSIRSAGVELDVTYEPGKIVSSGSMPGFTFPLSITRNSIANRLKAKARQLRRVSFDGPLGVILCDGDCAALRGMGPPKAPHFYTGPEIVADFFKRHASFSFVVFVTARDHRKDNKPRVRFQTEVFTNSRARFPCPDALVSLFKALPQSMPRPENTPENVLLHYAREGPHTGWSHAPYYELTWSHGMAQIRLSARALLEVLAEKETLAKFLAGHHMAPSALWPDATNFFKRQLESGHLLTDVKFVADPESDDDWIVLTFGGPDPALTRLRLDRRTD
jgi:hypothetical protein